MALSLTHASCCSVFVLHWVDHKHNDRSGNYDKLGFREEQTALLNLLKSCGRTKDLHKGRIMHSDVILKGLVPEDIYVGTALISMYAKCGAFEEANIVFHNIPKALLSVVSWNALISGYSQHGFGNEALVIFKEMRKHRVLPNTVTFTCALKACGSTGSLRTGEEIHAEVTKQGLLEKNIILGNALVDMYAKCGLLRKAQEIFDQLPVRDVISWSVLITGYAHHGLGGEALKCFDQMRDEGISPDSVTFICVLKSCGCVGSLELGEEIHDEVRKQGLLEKNVVLGTALVDMYVKCGEFMKAEKVFEELPTQSVGSWSALISGYDHHGLGYEALKCFQKMQDKGIAPDAVTFICIFKACANMGSLQMGQEIHAEVCKQGLIERNLVLANTLVDMYTKCGVLKKAREVFEVLPMRDVVSWNVLISGYAQLGQIKKVFYLLCKMMAEGIMPSLVSFLLLLTACSHAGLVKEGQLVFKEMGSTYSLTPVSEHYACMVDLFSRAGHFNQAMIMIGKVPSSERLTLCLAFLGACHKWINVDFGRWAFEQSVHLDGKCGAAYVCMRNIYSAVGMYAEANEIEVRRIKNKAWEDTRMFWVD